MIPFFPLNETYEALGEKFVVVLFKKKKNIK